MKSPKSFRVIKKLFPTPYSLLSASGFTIIEILVVFTLIASLSGIGFAAFVNYSRSQQVNQTANDIKLLIGQARSNALSGVKTNTSPAGEVIDCYNANTDQIEPLDGYSIVKIGEDKLQLKQLCENLSESLIKEIQLPNNIEFTLASTCATIMFDSLTSQAMGAPCNLVVSGYGITKHIAVDAIGNASVRDDEP